MGVDWLVLADDLTGAADCGIAFARRGVRSVVAWGDHAPAADGRRGVLSYDVGSRGLSADHAAERHRVQVDRLLGASTPLFKKIDSTLRGQPAAEVAACLAGLRARGGRGFGVLAPAFPATGRTVIDGRLRVAGRPLEEAEVWRRDHSYASADLVAVLASAGVVGEVLPLATVRSEGDALRRTLASLATRGDVVAVCDAEVQDDLARVAAACASLPTATLHVGSAGLAHALADLTCGTERDPSRDVGPREASVRHGGTLLVVGTLAAVSRRAARRTVDAGHARHVPVAPALLLNDADAAGRAALVDVLSRILSSGNDAMVEVAVDDSPDLSIGPRLATALADVLFPVLSQAGALVATGGETAAALLTRFGVTGIRLLDEIEPGACLGLTLGAVSLPVVTKAGAFGDEGSLTRIAEHLRNPRQNGPTP